MRDFDPDNFSNPEDDDIGGVAWSEFDWEHYLREQDDVLLRYVGFYELFEHDEERLEKVARSMGWAMSQAEAEAREDDAEDDEPGPYTVHENYIYVAIRAIYMKMTREWERIAADPERVPQRLAVEFLGALNRGEANAMLAVHALDLGDFTMAVSLFKRTFAAINRAIAILDEKASGHSASLAKFRERALRMLFDLREIALRMMDECREAIGPPVDDDPE